MIRILRALQRHEERGATDAPPRGRTVMTSIAMRAAIGLGAAVALFATEASAQPRENCLAYRDIQQLDAVDQTTAIARTRRDSYTITFRARCMARSTAANFIITDHTSGICVTRGDRFALSTPQPPCTVESVTIRPENAR
jgi:hypothetical protein